MSIGEYSNSSSNTMGYGSNNAQNTNSSKMQESTFYSRFKVKSADGRLSLSFNFRSGLLICSINEVKDTKDYSNTNSSKNNNDALISIFLSPTKAFMFSKEIQKFLDLYNNGDIVEGRAFGVNAGMGEKVTYIGIHANNNKAILLTIGKIDNNGNITEQVTMELAREYYYSLEWNDINAMDVNKSYFDLLDITQIQSMMEDFSRTMTGALSYGVWDLGRYDLRSMTNKLNPIYDKLGIERLNNGNNNFGGYKPNNFLANAGKVNTGSVSNHTTIDEIDDLLGD